MIANNAIRPSFTEENGVKALTLFIPTQENIEQYPEAFYIKRRRSKPTFGEKMTYSFMGQTQNQFL